MGPNINETEPLDDFTDEQIENLGKSIDTLELENQMIIEDEIEVAKIRQSQKKPFRRLRKSPLEIINRLLFLVFLASFLCTFVLINAVNSWWCLFYIISSFSCVLYTPNRKALKELIAAWPNIEELIKSGKK
ncbi:MULTISPECIES: hypothetical protein [unclassified Prochlorococcus]|uniref:hypothetical protein n=1 Tax=unclassified Prochlorococcus TaxID=2627481 RepID=UPI0005339A41|nr:MULTISPECIES: hypothetical protein [unclassified Prochlorococcus]KGG16135.1 hypothetical protein EV06_0845 [Prochlorococcus sp. MIT 0602]KGG17253.1 hypothetical protein EV07_0691 [Prochlorococcus sp. MIT 0603]